MTAKIIDGKLIATEFREKIKEYIKQEQLSPSIAVILIGENPASEVYVRNKRIACEKAGIKFKLYKFRENVSEYSILSLLDELNVDKDVNGIFVQMPIPKHINQEKIIERISPIKDIDGFHPYNVGKLYSGMPILSPCTPMGIVHLIKSVVGDNGIKGKNTVVIGRSLIVGKPISAMMSNLDATVTIAHSKSENLKEIAKRADILISATGRKHMIDENYIKENAVVIDVGIVKGDDGKLYGDVDFDRVKDIAGAITPVPGGVGPMTIAMILYNAVKSYCLINGKKFEL